MRTVTAILCRRGLPGLRDLDPMTGALIGSSRAAAVRCERDRPGELAHVDVKKPGRIPDGGGWRAHGRAAAPRGAGGGFDFARSAVDDHSRLAYSEVLVDEKGATCAGFMQRAAERFAVYGIGRVERVLTDNALACRASTAFAAALIEFGAAHKRTRSLTECGPARFAALIEFGAAHKRTRPYRLQTIGKSSASTAPSKPNGPTTASTPTTTSAPPPSRYGSTTTITTDHTTP